MERGEGGESAVGNGCIGCDAGVESVKQDESCGTSGAASVLDGDVIDVEGGEVLPEHYGVFLVGARRLKEKSMGIPFVFCVVDDSVLFFGTIGIAAELPEGRFGGIMVISLPATKFSGDEIPIRYQINGNRELFS